MKVFFLLKYKRLIIMVQDIEDTLKNKSILNKEYGSTYGTEHLLFKDMNEINEMIKEGSPFMKLLYKLIDVIDTINNKREYTECINKLSKEYKVLKTPKNSHINIGMRLLCENGKITLETMYKVLKYSKVKNNRSISGILEVAIMTKPSKFSCAYDCYYCPNQENMPRSYVAEGPAARRAATWGFDTIKQLHSRLSVYSINGHDIDKLEIIVLGGTWSSYSMEYRREFTNEVYYAANTFFDIPDKDGNYRKMLPLKEEQEINTNGKCKIVGFTIETRPDEINMEEIKSFLDFGVTRVQLGWQHTSNKILKKINRQCTLEDIKKSNKLLRDNGFKVLCHIMPNLPGSSPELDTEMFNTLNTDNYLFSDEMKIYPTIIPTTSHKDTIQVNTVIEKWFYDGKYEPYSDEELMDVLIKAKSNIPEFTRISRVFRDIPKPNTISGCERPNMRQIIHNKMDGLGLKCKCIRCSEVRDLKYSNDEIFYSTLKYECCDGVEHFITCNVIDKTSLKKYLLGFIRLRLPNQENYVGNLPSTALIRELHVYSKLSATYKVYNNDDKSSQHKGIGKKLLYMAEECAKQNNYKKISITSGVGVRGYYSKKGYNLNNGYMVKEINNEWLLTKIINNVIGYIW